MKKEFSGVVNAIFVFILVVLVIIALLYFLDLLALIIAILGFICAVGLIIGVIVIGILFILAAGYFMVTKSPEIQEHGNYSLDDTIDHEDFKKQG